MIQSLSVFNKKFQLTLLLVFFGLSQLLAQTVAVSTVKHETLGQNQIVVTYTGAGGATGVQVNGGGAGDVTLCKQLRESKEY